MSVVIAKFSNKKDATLIAGFARKHKGKVKLLKDEAWEDLILGHLIDEAEKEGGEVPLTKILNKLKTNGNNR